MIDTNQIIGIISLFFFANITILAKFHSVTFHYKESFFLELSRIIKNIQSGLYYLWIDLTAN